MPDKVNNPFNKKKVLVPDACVRATAHLLRNSFSTSVFPVLLFFVVLFYGVATKLFK